MPCDEDDGASSNNAYGQVCSTENPPSESPEALTEEVAVRENIHREKKNARKNTNRVEP